MRQALQLEATLGKLSSLEEVLAQEACMRKLSREHRLADLS
jgi:hypothetical protein